MEEPIVGKGLLSNPTTQFCYINLQQSQLTCLLRSKKWLCDKNGDYKEPMAPPKLLQVTDHWDQYMDAKGFYLLKTSRPDNMYSWENLATRVRATSETSWAP